jgi:hypothetical protein
MWKGSLLFPSYLDDNLNRVKLVSLASRYIMVNSNYWFLTELKLALAGCAQVFCGGMLLGNLK